MKIGTLKRNRLLNSCSIETLFLGTSGTLLLSLYQSYVRMGSISSLQLILSSGLVLFLIVYFSNRFLKKNWLNNWIRKFGFYPVLWFASFSLWFGDILAFSANAQVADETGFFFTNIQNKIIGILGEGADGAGAVQIINFGFGILQLAMILYIAFSIFQAIKAQQQDEEWIQSAKVPLIVLFAVTAGDFAVGLI